MAVQKENGYTAIANELMEALSHFRIPGEVRQVLDAIMRKTYGYSKKEDWIANSQIVSLTGLKKANVSRSLSRLITHNVVIKVDNKLSLNKNHVSWIPFDNKLSRLITPVINADKKLSRLMDTKANNKNNTLSKDKVVKTRLVLDKKEKDKHVELILVLFERYTQTQPSDKTPRRVAWNLLQKTRTLIREIRPHFPSDRIGNLEEETILKTAFDWYFKQLPEDVQVIRLETVKLSIASRYYFATRKKYIPNYQLQKAS